MKRILIACEYSGIVREAFRLKGFDAWSCDLLPSDIPGQHLQGDIIQFIHQHWDALIGFPPCTFLTYAGNKFWSDLSRVRQRIEAAAFFMKLFTSPVEKICLEQPQGIMNKIFRQPDQIVHPYYFGDPHMKRTGLYLKNLPPLKYSLQQTLFEEPTACTKPEPVQVQFQKKTGKMKARHFCDSLSNNKLKSGHEKSKTFPAIAQAMADQWAPII
jgi:hypothetical protein